MIIAFNLISFVAILDQNTNQSDKCMNWVLNIVLTDALDIQYQ